jgi:DNA polymerase (family 10)
MSKNEHIPLKEAEEKSFIIQQLFLERGVWSYVGGSIARKVETCGDVDLVILEKDLPVIDRLVSYSIPEENQIRTKKGVLVGMIMLGMKVELYLAKENAVDSMCLFCEGSGKFNIQMRAKAKAKGFKLSQYGLFNADGSLVKENMTEAEIFKAIEMPYVLVTERNL